MTELAMPRLTDSMEQGTILTWLKADGEQAQAGEDLLEIETDKATVTHAAEVSGVLQIIAPEGTTLPVGASIAHIGAEAAAPPPTTTPTTTTPPDGGGGGGLTAGGGRGAGAEQRGSAKEGDREHGKKSASRA